MIANLTDSGALYLGTMTGTSVDGLDIALLDVSDGLSVPKGQTIPLPADLSADLQRLIRGDATDEVELLGHCDTALAEFTAIATLQFLEQLGLQPNVITAIGSHGQTIRHRPDEPYPFTLQIGDANIIAERTGITTIADFRRRDIAAGGQGAPLVPMFHQAIFSQPHERRVIVNVGGIANITRVAADEPLAGFDTGPGNTLMDAWTQKHFGAPYDASGQWAAAGTCDASFLQELLADPYLAKHPPKSTGREYFNLDWLRRYPVARAMRPVDVQATLCQFTAQSIVRAITRYYPRTDSVIVCGGGRRNDHLMHLLTTALEPQVMPSEAFGVDGDSLEAAAFAWLAFKRLRNEPASLPSITGTTAPRVLGVIYPA
ncbi:MAG: anhydro-N-acetylmuramic acid kinase [Pseudomonadales bacterium]